MILASISKTNRIRNVKNKKHRFGHQPRHTTIGKVVREVPDIVSEDIQRLHSIFPHVFTEGKGTRKLGLLIPKILIERLSMCSSTRSEQ